MKVVSPSTANLGEDIPLPAQANLYKFSKRQSHIGAWTCRHSFRQICMISPLVIGYSMIYMFVSSFIK